MAEKINLNKLLTTAFIIMLFLLPSTNAFSGLSSNSWELGFNSRLTVAGEFTVRDHTSGAVYLTPESSKDGTFSAFEGSYEYTGTYKLYRSGGKQKLKITFDENGKTALKNMMINWITEHASEGGISVSGLSIKIKRIGITHAIISKKTGKPGKIKITIVGSVSGYKNGKYATRNISYQTTVRFKSPL